MTRLEPTASPILRMEGVSKRYGGVRALANADLVVFTGRIHAILGENGAGKSTLIKILSGVVAPDAGRIVLDEAEVAFDSPPRPTAPALSASSRSFRSFPTFRSPITSQSPIRRAASG